MIDANEAVGPRVGSLFVAGSRGLKRKHSAFRNAEQPYSESAFPKETNELRPKFIRGGILGGQVIGFLWSQRAPT